MTVYLSIITSLLTLALFAGLGRVLIGPSRADRMLASQLFGTAGVAVLILLAVIQKQPALLNVALILALLAPLTLMVFIKTAEIKS